MPRLYVFYKGESSNQLYRAIFDGTTWTGDTHLSQLDTIRSDTTPIFAGGRLIFKGANSVDLFSCEGAPGQNLFVPPVVQIGADNSAVQSGFPVSAAPYRNFTYMGYRYPSTNDLCVAFMDAFGQWHWDGAGRIVAAFSNKARLDPKSSEGPAVAVFRDRLWFVYKGESSGTLYTLSHDGTSWYGNQPINDQGPPAGRISPESNHVPAVAVFGGAMHLIYKGAHSNDLYSAWFDGTAWHGNTRIADQPGGIAPQSNHSPAAIKFQDRLYIVYKGAVANDLYVAWFDGRAWHGNTRIADLSSISPKSNVSPSLFTDGPVET